jgi:hypothetical protein
VGTGPEGGGTGVVVGRGEGLPLAVGGPGERPPR